MPVIFFSTLFDSLLDISVLGTVLGSGDRAVAQTEVVMLLAQV